MFDTFGTELVIKNSEAMAKIDTSNFVDELCGIDPNYESEIKILEEKYNCEISCDTEKHNLLQLTYFVLQRMAV